MVLLALTLELLACPAPEPSRLELVGVLLDDDPAERVAVLRDARASRSFTVRPGDVVEGSNELAVEAGALVVRRFRARVEGIERGRVLLDGRSGLEVASSSTAWVEQRECRPLFDPDRLTQLAPQARIVPAFERGVPIGFKLFSIRPGSTWSAAGLENGDVVERINGLDLTSPEKALVIYSTLRCARRFRVELRRGNERIDLTLMPTERIESEARLLPGGQGAFIVTELTPQSLLARAGLRHGDVIISIENEPLTIRYSRDGQRRRALVRSSSALRSEGAATLSP
jgi:type II secretory pathway component PulC